MPSLNITWYKITESVLYGAEMWVLHHPSVCDYEQIPSSLPPPPQEHLTRSLLAHSWWWDSARWFFWFSICEKMFPPPTSPVSLCLHWYLQSNKQNSCSPDIARGILHCHIFFLLTVIFSLTISIPFYIITLYCCGLFFSFLKCCNRPVFIFLLI